MAKELNKNIDVEVNANEQEHPGVAVISLITGFYKNNKKKFDIAFYVILGIAVIIAIVVNNQKKKQQQIETLSGSFFVKMYEGNSEEMFSIGENIKQNYIGKKGTAPVLFIMANKYLQQNKRDKAIEVFESIVNNYSKTSNLREYSLSKLAYLYTYTDEKKAIDAFKKLINSYPKSVLLGDWSVELAKLYLHNNNKEAAKVLCKNVIDSDTSLEQTKKDARNLLAIINNV